MAAGGINMTSSRRCSEAKQTNVGVQWQFQMETGRKEEAFVEKEEIDIHEWCYRPHKSKKERINLPLVLFLIKSCVSNILL